jgi:hypothetical protein
VLFRENESGQVYGITFVDHHNKTVFNGSDLGKAYSAKAITERFTQVNRAVQTEKNQTEKLVKAGSLQHNKQEVGQDTNGSATASLLELLLEKSQPEYFSGISRKKKKRKKKGQTATQELTI